LSGKGRPSIDEGKADAGTDIGEKHVIMISAVPRENVVIVEAVQDNETNQKKTGGITIEEVIKSLRAGIEETSCDTSKD
jgi:hypothetical protein